MRTMDEKIRVQRRLAGTQGNGHRFAEAIDIIDDLREYVAIGGVRLAPWVKPAEVRPGENLHRAIRLVHIVDREPHSHGFRGCERPVGAVLMPGHASIVTRQLAEKVGRPANQVGTEDVFHRIEQSRMPGKIMNHRHAILIAVDREAVLPVRAKMREQGVELSSGDGGFFRIEHIDTNCAPAYQSLGGLSWIHSDLGSGFSVTARSIAA